MTATGRRRTRRLQGCVPRSTNRPLKRDLHRSATRIGDDEHARGNLGGTDHAARRSKRFLSPSQKYEIWRASDSLTAFGGCITQPGVIVIALVRSTTPRSVSAAHTMSAPCDVGAAAHAAARRRVNPSMIALTMWTAAPTVTLATPSQVVTGLETPCG